MPILNKLNRCLLIVVYMAIVSLFLSCSPRPRPHDSNYKNIKESLSDSAQYANQSWQDFQQKMADNFSDLNSSLTKMENLAEQKKGKAADELNEKIAQLKTEKNQLQEKLNALGKESKDSYQNAMNQIERDFARLKEKIEQAL